MHPPHPPLSFSMQLLQTWLRWSQRNAMYRSPAQLHAMLRKPPSPAAPPRSDAQLHVQALLAPAGWQCWELAPQHPPAAPSACWLYLHGGAYVRPITHWHWRMLRTLVLGSGCRVRVAQYPLAPASPCERTVVQLQQACTQWMPAETPWGLMGDSAGAGMAVALTLAQRDTQQQMAQQLLLITPWLDVALNDAATLALAPLDVMLAPDGAREAGRLYAGSLPTSHPWVSPVHADLQGLPPIQLWCAEHDICTPAALRFAERARQCGTPVNIHHGPCMLHAWPLLPVAEARLAQQQLIAQMQQAF